MKFTDEFNLPYPESTDYADPLHLQLLAERLEAILVAMRTQVTDLLTQPTAIWQRQSGAFAFGTTGVTTTNLFSNDCIFANYRDANGQFPSFTESSCTCFPEPGLYWLGCHVSAFAAVGVNDDNSTRLLQLQVQKLTSAGYVAVEPFGRRVYADGPTNGDYLSAECTVVVNSSEFRNFSVSGALTHTNISSNMNLPQGGMYAWCTRIGSTDLIEVT